MSDDDVLDCEQRAAVEATDRAIAVLAGPGSGKTRTLSYRARHLLREAPGSRALLLTFTNKAAAEMKSRAIGVAAVASDRIDAGTFHNFGSRILRNHGALVGLEPEFEILDDGDTKQLARNVSRSRGLSNMLSEWQASRLERRNPGSAAAFGTAYQAAKLAEGVVDFDDLVALAAELLEGHDALAQVYGGQYAHLLIDEFQDTNAVQFAIVRALAPHVGTISVFADDDQAIFRFVGAEAENIRRFAEVLDAVEYPLTCNYRSRERIVECANALIAADPQASGRQMHAHRPGGEVELLEFETLQEEAEALTRDIGELLSDVPPTSVSVLVRSGYRADALVASLRQARIPVTDWRGEIHAPEERRAFVAAMSALRGRLTPRRAARLCDLLDIANTEAPDTHALLSSLDRNPVAAELLRLRSMAFDGAPPPDLAQQAQVAITASDAALGARITPLLEAVTDFARHDSTFTVDDMLAELALGAGGRSPTQGGGVRVPSLHRTKGLQWPIVYLLGMEDKHMPDYRCPPEEIPDERRACFVGVCRAEDRLILTFARYFKGYERDPSPFLSELGFSVD